MQRAAWKIPFISRFFFFKSFGNNCKIFTRNSTIYRKLVKKTLRVYSGKNWITLNIQRVMVGHKIGEFALTKIMGSAIDESMYRKGKAKIKLESLKASKRKQNS